MKKLIFLFIVLIVLIAVFIMSQGNVSNIMNFFGKRATITYQNKKITAIVAQTEKDRQIGLSNRKSLGKNQGMLFIFDKADIYPFWMKNMLFPIDIVFIKDSTIVTIYKNVQPPNNSNDNLKLYTPSAPINRVLELQANETDDLGVKVGSTLSITL